MRLLSHLVSILTLTAASARLAVANSLAEEALDLESGAADNTTIAARCANPCGYYGQLCCQSGETCFTDANNEAQCQRSGGSGSGAMTTTALSGNGYWQYVTSTWVETNTVTKTQVYSTWVGGATAAHPTTPAVVSTAVPANCKWDQGESSCGNICCPSGQYCQVSGQCAAAGSPSAPLRPTSSGTGVVTQTSFSTTTTVPFGTPIATGQTMPITQSSQQSSTTLSGGAIAGIVIGVIIAIIILILLALCLCARTAWEGLLALFGLGKRRRNRRETVEYESYHRSGRSGGGAAAGRTWYGGTRPARVNERIEQIDRRDTRGTKRAGGLAAGFGGLATAMGLRRNRDREERRRREEEKSEATSYMYSESDYTASSDRRTRDSRRTGRR